MRKAKYNFGKTLVNGVASNPKCLRKYVQSKTTDGTITSDDSEIAEILNNFLVAFSLMRIHQTYHHLELSIQENPCHLCKSLLSVSGGSYVDLTRLNLLVPITVILKFFRRSGGFAAASIPAVQKVIRRGSVAYSMKGSYGNSNF